MMIEQVSHSQQLVNLFNSYSTNWTNRISVRTEPLLRTIVMKIVKTWQGNQTSVHLIFHQTDRAWITYRNQIIINILS